MEQEHPFYFNLNPVCSIWPEPLLKSVYKQYDTTWKIEKGCEKRYIMSFVDQKDIKSYKIGSFLRKKSDMPCQHFAT